MPVYYSTKVPKYNSVAHFLESTFIGFDDLMLSLTSGKVGANAKPDFDYTNLGYLFARNDATEIIYLITQLPHNRTADSDIFLHLHWQQMNSNNVVWVVEYKWINIGDTVPADFSTLTSTAASHKITYTSGNIHQITDFGSIDGTDKGISSVLLIKLYRTDNIDAGAGTGDALAWQMDIHYEIDSFGSYQEYVK